MTFPNTTFVSKITKISSTWLHAVNDFIVNFSFPISTVTNIAAVRLLTASATRPAVSTSGYYTTGDGGSGTYWYNAADTTSADNGGTIIVSTVDGSRWYLAVTGPISVRQFGAKGIGSSFNDGPFIQACMTWCEAHNVPCYVPGTSSYYYVNATGGFSGQLVATNLLEFYGDGLYTSQIISTWASAGGAIQVNITSTVLGMAWHDFLIGTATPGQGVGGTNPATGTSGIRIVLSAGGYMSNSELQRIAIGGASVSGNGDFAGWGLIMDNSVGNGDGFFTLTVRRCVIFNGINAILVGDSCDFWENTITEGLSRKNTGTLGMVGLQVTAEPGAADISIVSNNVTTSGGALIMTGVTNARIENNQFEFPSYKTGSLYTPYGASNFASYGAMIYLSGTTNLTLSGNSINTGADNFTGYISAAAILTSGTGTVNLTYLATNIFAGAVISGPGIPQNTRVTAVATWSGGTKTQLGISQNATASFAGPPYATISIGNANVSNTGPFCNTFTITGNTHTSTTIDSLSSVTGLQAGMTVDGLGITPGTTIISVGASSILISAATSSSNTGITVSVNCSMMYALSIVDTSSSLPALYNLFENNAIYKGTNGHINVGCAASSPAIQLGMGNSFLGSVPQYAQGTVAQVPISIFPYTTTTHSGNITHQGNFLSAQRVPTVISYSGTGFTATAGTETYQMVGNSVVVDGLVTVKTGNANPTISWVQDLPIQPLVTPGNVILYGMYTGITFNGSGVNAGSATNGSSVYGVTFNGNSQDSSGSSTYTWTYHYAYQIVAP